MCGPISSFILNGPIFSYFPFSGLSGLGSSVCIQFHAEEQLFADLVVGRRVLLTIVSGLTGLR